VDQIQTLRRRSRWTSGPYLFAHLLGLCVKVLLHLPPHVLLDAAAQVEFESKV